MGCASSTEDEPPARTRRARAGSAAEDNGTTAVERVDLNRQPSKSALKQSRNDGKRRVSWVTADELRKSANDIEKEESGAPTVAAEGGDASEHDPPMASPCEPADNAAALATDSSPSSPATDGGNEPQQQGSGSGAFDGVAPAASEPGDDAPATNPLQEAPADAP